MQSHNERRPTRSEAAVFLSERGYRVAYATLNKYAVIGGGPAFTKFGRKPLYTQDDLLTWAQSKTSRLVHSTSELQAA